MSFWGTAEETEHSVQNVYVVSDGMEFTGTGNAYIQHITVAVKRTGHEENSTLSWLQHQLFLRTCKMHHRSFDPELFQFQHCIFMLFIIACALVSPVVLSR